MDNTWIHDPNLSDIDTNKLQTIASLAAQGEGLKQKELLPFLMAAASRTSKQSIQFSENELQAILAVLKKNKSPNEQQKMDRLFALIKQMQSRPRY